MWKTIISMKKFLFAILYYYRTLFLFKRFLNKNSLLLEGKYKFIFCSKPILYNVQYHNHVAKYMENDNKYLDFLNFTISIKKHPNKGFCGQALRLTVNGKWQIYDFQNNQVLTVFKDKHIMKKIQYSCNYFKGKLLIPYEKTTDLGIIDKYIYDNIDMFATDLPKQKELFLAVMYDIKKFLILSDDRAVLSLIDYKISWKCDVLGLNKLLEELESQISIKSLSKKYVHGDLHIGNILISKEGKLYYIDFENSREDVFFYDCFNYIYVDFTYNNNPFLLDAYLDRDVEIMNSFKSLFGAVGFHFLDTEIIQYLYIFLQRRIIENVKYSFYKKTTKDREMMLVNYKKFYNYINDRSDFT